MSAHPASPTPRRRGAGRRKLPRFALIHSPLVGASCWRGVERSLQRGGHQALAIDYGPPLDGGWYGEAAGRIAAALGAMRGPSVVIVHSGAGGLVPSIVEAAPTMVAEVLFIDAILPHPGRSWFETAPTALAEHLRTLAKDGHLPPWNEWFDADPTVGLIGDAGARAAFAADLPRVPLVVLDAPAPAVRHWDALPCAYLQLSDAYEAEARETARRGWRSRREPMHHLAMIPEPDKVAALIVEMTRP